MLKVTKAWETIKNYNKKSIIVIWRNTLPYRADCLLVEAAWHKEQNSQFKESWLETTANVHFIHNSNVQSK